MEITRCNEHQQNGIIGKFLENKVCATQPDQGSVREIFIQAQSATCKQ